MAVAGVFVGIVTGFIGGYMAGKNGFPYPWQHIATVAYAAGIFLAIGLAAPRWRAR